jgi:TPP-dependent pyruvate/acetoin dehydrogenase alpha subunit
MVRRASSDSSVDAKLLLDLYRMMLIIRGVEDRVQRLFLRGEIYGTTHLYSGQEAVAAGVASTLGSGDCVACTYRGHGHLLAMGADPRALLAELLGRATGLNGGRAGSMNMTDPANGVLGCYGIVGGSIAAATGAALTLRGTEHVAVAYFGDGATNQAYFFECLNFASVLELPVLFVCENNGYGEYTPTESVTPGGIVTRAAAFEIPSHQVDGMDVSAVHLAAREIVAAIRSGGGPQFLEALTYRFVGHSRSDPGAYRPPGELERWRERDPILLAAAALHEQHGETEAAARVEVEVEAQLEEAEEAALAAPFPEELRIPEFCEAAASE